MPKKMLRLQTTPCNKTASTIQAHGKITHVLTESTAGQVSSSSPSTLRLPQITKRCKQPQECHKCQNNGQDIYQKNNTDKIIGSSR